jgi:hypothetical protein
VTYLCMSFAFSCQTQEYTKKLAHISLCIIEFICRTMSQHVPAHGAIVRRYTNKPYTIELLFFLLLVGWD